MLTFDFTTIPATFIERPNRYRVVAQLQDSGAIVSAHCPDPGRLTELLLPGVVLHISPAPASATRKTHYDLRFVEHPEHGQLISLDTRLPNRLFELGLRSGFFPLFRGFQSYRRETPLPDGGAHAVHSRIDFRLIDATGAVCWVEVKSATLVEDRVARFPDAVTGRGLRHVQELTGRLAHGERAAVVFIVQRPDADRLEPHWARDPDFAQALTTAATRGVALLACTCRLTTTQMALERLIPVVTAPYQPVGEKVLDTAKHG